ncbi:MAG: restriction endonuclease subunit S [Pseudoalteromonas prydzensis]|uniref:restriction endonuclease subunit S n=1 Tax=Pseudoalteromonas prydzensis TaxID=182141 RepID=UPI003F97F046
MGSNWKTTTLADISERIGDGLHGTPKYSDDGEYYFVNGNNLESGAIVYKDSTKRVGLEEYNKHKKELGSSTVLVSINGTIGNVALYNGEEVVLGKSACYINLKKGISKEFVKYILSGYLFQEYIQRCSTGSTIKNVSLKMMRDFAFRIPDTEIEQDKAVELLKLLDHKISLNNQTNQTLESMAQALFKSWFVDFDPVFDNLLASVDFNVENLETSLPDELKQKAQRRLAALNSLENAAQCKASLSALAHELQAQLPTKEATQAAVQVSEKAAETPVKANFNANPDILAQHANTHAHFPNEFEHNEQLGWIPKGWSATSVEDEFVVKGGSTPSTKNPDFWEGGEIHWTSPKDLSGNTTKIMLDTSRKITSAGLKKITSGLLPIDTVLMSSRAPVGYLALAKVPVAINQGYIAITDAKTLSSEYTIQWLDSVMDEIKGISGGTTFAEISKKTFKSIQLVIPSKKAVEAYTEVTKMYYERITASVQEINTLTETRDYLLPKLISGELQIPDVATDDETVD